MATSGKSSQESRPSSPIWTNPLASVYQNLFGQPVKYNPMRSGYQAGPADMDYQRDPLNPGSAIPGGMQFANQLFNRESFGVLEDQLAPIPENPYSTMAGQNLDAALGMYESTLMPRAQELAATGFRTDIDPIREAALRDYQREIVPGLAEQFSFLGGPGQTLSSDFGAAAAGAGADLFTELGGLQTQLDEAAADRSAQGLQLGALLGQSYANLPLEVGSNILSLDEQWFDQQLLERPGGQLMNFLSNLQSTLQPDPILQANISTGDASNWGAL